MNATVSTIDLRQLDRAEYQEVLQGIRERADVDARFTETLDIDDAIVAVDKQLQHDLKVTYEGVEFKQRRALLWAYIERFARAQREQVES